MGEVRPETIQSLCVALGIGLLVGADRERIKGLGATRNAAGIRTFTVVALVGAVSCVVQNEWVMPTSMLALAALTAIAYYRMAGNDPGLTTEASLLLTFLLGALAVNDIQLAAGLGVVLSGVLASRDWLHQFVQRILSERELHDVIIFCALLLVIMPITPNRNFGPNDSINLYEIVRFVVMVAGISSLGYILKRVLGPRGGLPMAGFLGGFVSSTVVVMKMGQLTKTHPQSIRPAIGAALLSNAATLIQLQIVLAVLAHGFQNRIFYPLLYGLLVNLGLTLYWVYYRNADELTDQEEIQGSAFDLKTSIGFALLVTIVTLVSSTLHGWLGHKGVWVASAMSGIADAHSNISPVSALYNQGELSTVQVEVAVLLAYSTNSISKMTLALALGSRIYQYGVMAGLLLVLGVIWLAMLIQTPLTSI